MGKDQFLGPLVLTVLTLTKWPQKTDLKGEYKLVCSWPGGQGCPLTLCPCAGAGGWRGGRWQGQGARDQLPRRMGILCNTLAARGKLLECAIYSLDLGVCAFMQAQHEITQCEEARPLPLA